MNRRQLAVFLCLALPFLCRAEVVTTFGKKVNIPISKGYCAVEERPRESEILARMRFGIGTGSTLLLVYAKCEEVQAVRNPKSTYPDGFKDYVSVAVADPPLGKNKLEGISRQHFVSSGLRQLDTPEDQAKLAAELPRIVERLRAKDRGDKGVTNLGVLGYDKHAIYMGAVIEQTNASGSGIDRVLSVGAVTIVHALQISITHIKLSQNVGDLQAMLREQREAVAEFVNANP